MKYEIPVNLIQILPARNFEDLIKILKIHSNQFLLNLIAWNYIAWWNKKINVINFEQAFPLISKVVLKWSTIKVYNASLTV